MTDAAAHGRFDVERTLTGKSRILCHQVMRQPRFTRGNTNLRKLSPIDAADWIRAANPGKPPSFWRFEKSFRSDGSPLTLDVSADERFVLMIDGQIVGRGPNRSSVEHWVFHTWKVEISPGEHVMSAVVWQAGDFAPASQMSNGGGGGFILKADGSYDGQLTTGKARWRVGRLAGVGFVRDVHASRADGAGYGVEQHAPGFLAELPESWESPVSAVGDVRLGDAVSYGGRRAGWMLYPTTLPDQMENRRFPGEFRTGGEKRLPIRLATGEKRTVLWDLGDYHCAYPVFRARGGRGARIVWGWAESLFDSVDPKRQGWGRKGVRSDWQGKAFLGTTDVFFPDSAAAAEMTVPWWRCGRWCRLEIEAGDAPLVIDSLGLVETRYPLDDEGSFVCDDPTLGPVQAMCLRGMQMCSHEMLMDCPFYEQQMYAADTRVQLKVLSVLSADDRMTRRSIELLDFSRRDNGLCAMNFPSSGHQESSSFTPCWLMMLGDYVMTRPVDEWLRFRQPGMMAAAYGLRAYENGQGLLVGLPGWNFADWEPSWERGVPPHFCFSRDGISYVPRNEADIPPSGWGSGKWDTGYLSGISGVCIVDGDWLRFYYSGLRGNGLVTNREEKDWKRNGMYSHGSIGVATLRRDGFAGLVADARGEVVTKALVFSGGHLFVNAECRFGKLDVEVLDERGEVVPGFSAAECRTFAGKNATKAEIRWRSGRLEELAGRAVSFRFAFQVGTLYSFWVSPSSRGESRGYVAAGGPEFSGLRDL